MGVGLLWVGAWMVADLSGVARSSSRNSDVRIASDCPERPPFDEGVSRSSSSGLGVPPSESIEEGVWKPEAEDSGVATEEGKGLGVSDEVEEASEIDIVTGMAWSRSWSWMWEHSRGVWGMVGSMHPARGGGSVEEIVVMVAG